MPFTVSVEVTSSSDPFSVRQWALIDSTVILEQWVI